MLKTGCTCLILLALAGVSVVGMSAAQANLLLAPGFEVWEGAPDASGGDVPTTNTPPGNPWIGWNPWVPPYTGFYTVVVAHSGYQVGKTFGQPSGLYQYVNVAGADGLPFQASAWFINFSGDPLLGGTSQTVDLRVTFFDGPNGTGNNLGLFVSPTYLDGTTPQDVWIQLSVNGVVPAGAVSAQVMGFMWNPVYAGGALFMDDASFVIIPEPASLALMLLCAGGLLCRSRSG